MYNFLNGLTLQFVDKGIYDIDKTSNISEATTKIIKMVGGLGGLFFTLAVMIIAVVIIFGSISPKSIGIWWKALFSCVAGALLFFSAYLIGPSIANVFG